jgi:peroxiredoxin
MHHTCSASLAWWLFMSLKAQLDACRCGYEMNAEPRAVDIVRGSIRALTETGIIAKAVKAGEMAPLFRLQCRRGGFIHLSDLLDRGPVVISFFRGDWCPFCVLELEALAVAHPEIERLGATLIALSPQAQGKLSPPGNIGERPFPVLQDLGCEIAARYRIAFTVPRQYRAAYLALGSAHAANNGSKGWVLPIPATYLLDNTGLIVLSYLDVDHTTRLEPTEIIAALTHLRASNIPDGNNR